MERARTLLREREFPGAFRPLVQDDVDDLRDHIAGALDHHGVADPDVAPLAQHLALVADALDIVLVVQRDVLHDHTADADRFELADRRERAGATNLNLDVAQHSHGPLGREFMRDAPARRARDEAEPLLPVDAIDLVDDAIDIVVELGALFLDALVERDQLLDGVAQLGQRIGLEAAALEPADHAALRAFRHRAHLPPRIGEEAEGARGGDGRVLLPERTGGRIARVGKDGVAGRLLPLLEREERLFGHVDLAADLADVGHVAPFQLLRHVFERADVGGDILADRTVAARRRGDELAALVAQRHREAVDLRLGGEIDLVVVELQEAHDAADEVAHVLFCKGVVERQHRNGVPNLLEAA
ncbi:hypothetical protein ABH972_003446 [Bradyrhizobium ottawaense]